jgi:hypothetical protein
MVSDGLEFVVRAVLIGAGATAVLDLWALFAARFFGVPFPHWAFVGRWIGYFPRGRFAHESIARAAAVPGELAIGWIAHYAIGIFYAAVLLAIWGLDWALRPTPLPALVISWVGLVAPFFIMQPGMGAGIASSKMPMPSVARLRSVVTHTVFGIGLYVAAAFFALLIPA